MSETLGSLCDKLTIVKLKQYHTEKPERLQNLTKQESQLIQEIDDFVSAAVAGTIPVERLTFAANKVYPKLNEINVTGSFGDVISKLAEANSKVWHEQEKAYSFDKVPVDEKDQVVKNLMIFNLERSHCMDQIDILFKNYVTKK